MADKTDDAQLISKLRTDYKSALVAIGYALDPEFNENVGYPEMQAAITKLLTKSRGELPQRTRDLAAAQKEIQDQRELLAWVSRSLCELMGLDYSPTKSARTVMASINEQVIQQRLDRTQAARELADIQFKIRSMTVPLGLPDLKDFHEVLAAVVSETTAQSTRYQELISTTENLRNCLRKAADTLCVIGGDYPLEANANDKEIISLVQKAVPNLDNFMRVDKLNQILGQRGSPTNYLPQYSAEHTKFRRAIETIAQFDKIVQAMYDDFAASKNSGFADLKKFSEDIRKQFSSLSPTIEPTTLSFLSKIISFIEAMAKVILQDHASPETAL
jgi:hypothetical protein